MVVLVEEAVAAPEIAPLILPQEVEVDFRLPLEAAAAVVVSLATVLEAPSPLVEMVVPDLVMAPVVRAMLRALPVLLQPEVPVAALPVRLLAVLDQPLSAQAA